MTILRHDHLALIRAETDKKFLEDLAQLDREGYDLVTGADIHHGLDIVAILVKPPTEAQAQFELEISEHAQRTEPPFDPAVS